jgi:hypothetical protein
MNGKSDARIRVGGTIHLAGPDIIERLAKGESVRFCDEHATELDLIIEKADKEKIVSFDPLVWIERADVSIHTDATDGDEVSDNLAIFIDGKFDRSIGLNLSVEQAEVLGRILTNYVAAFKAKQELNKTWSVKAA